jgi:predicted GIY-YIG superfamily endonuclease
MNYPCCYLLKLSVPLGTAKHSAKYYLGSCANLDRRLKQHKQGTAAAFTRAARDRGITFEVVQVWATTTVQEARQLESKLKKHKNHARLLRSYRQVSSPSK